MLVNEFVLNKDILEIKKGTVGYLMGSLSFKPNATAKEIFYVNGEGVDVTGLWSLDNDLFSPTGRRVEHPVKHDPFGRFLSSPSEIFKY